MARFYIDELKNKGFAPSELDNSVDDRQGQWDSEREKFGFDSRDTWSLKNAMTEMLYERLLMFMEKADEFVNLNYHKFEFEGNTYTQREMILMMIEDAKFSISYEYGALPELQVDDDVYDSLSKDELDKYLDTMNELEKDAVKSEQRVWQMWALVEPYMWW